MKANGQIDVSINTKGKDSDVQKMRKKCKMTSLKTGWRPLKMNVCIRKRSGLNLFLALSLSLCFVSQVYHAVLLSSVFSVFHHPLTKFDCDINVDERVHELCANW